MNINFLHSADYAITIHFVEGYQLDYAEWNGHFTNLQDAIDIGMYILRYIYPDSATDIEIYNATTGEIFAEIEQDE